jgi:hypothetical protein
MVVLIPGLHVNDVHAAKVRMLKSLVPVMLQQQ